MGDGRFSESDALSDAVARYYPQGSVELAKLREDSRELTRLRGEIEALVKRLEATIAR